MNLAPPLQQIALLLLDDAHRPPNAGAGHADSEHQLGIAIAAGEIDFGFAVTEHVDVGRLMVIDKDDDPQAVARCTVTIADDNLS